MPWLVGTALIHSLAVTEKRGAFKSWTVLLAIVAFSLSLLGTFLVRSGVLTSVHAFATDPARGIFILAFLAIVIGGSLTLFACARRRGRRAAAASRWCRANRCCSPTTSCSSSRWRACCSARCIRWSSTRSALGKISVGPPYFDAVFCPLMAPLVFLMGVGPIARWRQARVPDLWTRLQWALCVALATAAAAAVRIRPMEAAGRARPAASRCGSRPRRSIGLIQRLRSAPQRGFVDKLRANAAAWYGMLLAHLGVAVFIVGVTLVKGYEIERDVRLDVGQSVERRRATTFTFRGVAPRAGSELRATRRRRSTSRATAATVATLHPEKRIYQRIGPGDDRGRDPDAARSAIATCRSASR